jgi:hypothetical protein
MPRSRTSGLPPGCLVGILAAVIGCASQSAGPPRPSRRCPDAAIVVSSQADLAGLARCTSLPGITIRSAASLDVAALATLTTITGDLVIGPTVAMHDISLGGLRVVEGAVRVTSNSLVQRVHLPRLERAGQLAIEGNAALTTILLPRLVAVQGGLRVTGNAGLELIDVAALGSVGGDLALSGPLLALLEAGSLRSAGSIELDTPRLSAELVEQLRATAAP